MRPLKEMQLIVLEDNPRIVLTNIRSRRFDLLERTRLCEHGASPRGCEDPECVVRKVIES